MNAYLLVLYTFFCVKTQSTPLQPVFDSYFALKDAFIKSDAADASAKSTILLNALKEVDMAILSKEEHMQWMKSQSALISDATQISKAKDIEKQRSYFVTLSTNMIQLIKSSAPDSPVYLQHCPMANGGKGADWLSKESDVVNPYYGSRMLHCGKMVEKIE